MGGPEEKEQIDGQLALEAGMSRPPLQIRGCHILRFGAAWAIYCPGVLGPRDPAGEVMEGYFSTKHPKDFLQLPLFTIPT